MSGVSGRLLPAAPLSATPPASPPGQQIGIGAGHRLVDRRFARYGSVKIMPCRVIVYDRVVWSAVHSSVRQGRRDKGFSIGVTKRQVVLGRVPLVCGGVCGILSNEFVPNFSPMVNCRHERIDAE